MTEQHHDARLAEVRKLYKQISDRIYVGPQGPDMSVFLEEACELETLKKCNLEVFNSRLVSEERTKKFFIVKRHYERAEPTARNRMVHSITDTLDLTEDGHAFISSGDFVDKEVYKLVLRCGGGNLRGKLSGSNCIRVASRAGWCSGVGQCEDWCTFLKQPDSRNRLQHMCNFTVTLIATLHDIKEGRRRIYIEGNHGYPKTSDWLPPTILRPTVHIREHAVKTGISIKGPSASNILCTMVNSPSGESSRSYLSRSVYCKHVENYRRSLQITGTGPYHRIDTAIRSFVYPRTNDLAEAGKPFVIHYKGGIDPDTMEITIATAESLKWLRQLGTDRVVSDSRWFGGRFCKTCATCMLAVDPSLKYGVAGAIQFSSSESQQSLETFIEAVRATLPCSDDCDHRLVVTVTEEGYDVRRECSGALTFEPRVIIDKCMSARAGIRKAHCSVGVDLFHHFKSFSDNLKARGISANTVIAAGIDRLHRLRLRARTQDVVDFIIEEILSFIQHVCPQVAEVDPDVENYIKTALGYTGSPWEGCIGDIAQIEGHPVKNTSTNCAEGHHFAVQYCLNSGTAENQIDKTIIERTLGMTGMGTVSPEMTYFSYFREGYMERLSRAKTQPRKGLSPREKRTKYEGLFIAWKALWSYFVKNKSRYVKRCSTDSSLYFVKSGLPRIIRGTAVYEDIRENLGDVVGGIEGVCRIFDFSRAEAAIVPPGIIKKDGYYSVDTKTTSCFSCEFWLHNGSGSIKCKHIHAVEAFQLALNQLSEGKSADDVMSYISNDLCTYIKNRERSKSAAMLRDDIFLRGSHGEILRHLRRGAVSTLDVVPRSSNLGEASEQAAAVKAILEKRNSILSRRNLMLNKETDGNTCRICCQDDSVGEMWIGCDHEPRCLGGAGWYHMSCVKLKTEPEGSWFCDLCLQDDNEFRELQEIRCEMGTHNVKFISDDAVETSVNCSVGTVTMNCTVINNRILFMQCPTEQHKEFIALGLQLHDVISDIEVDDGTTWEKFDGSLNELSADELVRFTVRRGRSIKSAGPTSRELLPLSNDVRKVGCARDTYYQQSELPAWLAADAARPDDVQRVKRKGIRPSKYSNPNAKVARGSKKARTEAIDVFSKSALAILSRKSVNKK